MLFIQTILILFSAIHIKNKISKWLSIVIVLVVGSYLLIHAFSVFKYGHYLDRETESDALVAEGKIESMKEIKLSSTYTYDGVASHASIIMISGEEYCFMTPGNLEIGDEVSITYLPKSTVVLSVTITDSNE